MKNLFVCLLSIAMFCSAMGQMSNANWITHPTANLNDYGVYYFRNTVTINSLPKSLNVLISADTRYKLYVNGTYVTFGPARSDIKHWKYDSINIYPYLKIGENSIAVQVYNFGKDKPVAQLSSKTAFIFKGSAGLEDVMNTGKGNWKVIKDNAWQATKLEWWDWANGWYAIGCTDSLGAEQSIWGWQENGFDHSSWSDAKILPNVDCEWVLEVRDIPLMHEKITRFNSIRRISGITGSDNFIKGTGTLSIPANKTMSMILDHDMLTMGFPVIKTSKGKNSVIKITYAESPFTNYAEKGGKKVHRDSLTGADIYGPFDKFSPDGGSERMFSPNWIRVFRYVKLDIVTASEELIINDFYNQYTAYPYTENARFNSNDNSITPIWNASWKTMELCSFETMMDCPYYEQLNYAGDNHNQAITALYMSGDDRLIKSSTKHILNSINSLGILSACYPLDPKTKIIIPTYSLHTIDMLHDLYYFKGDVTLFSEYENTVKSILNWYDSKTAVNGLLGPLTEWNFVDWVFPNGEPSNAKTGGSALISLIFIKAMQDASDLFNATNNSAEANKWNEKAITMKSAVYNQCWDAAKNMMAETSAKNSYSEHTNSYAVITGTINQETGKTALLNCIQNANVTRTTPYFKCHFFDALTRCGLGFRILDYMDVYKNQLNFGLSTLCEHESVLSRSDCHAWNSHINFYLLYTIAGIQPMQAGFNSVLIKPELGNLNNINASIPYKDGNIEVNLAKSGSGLTGTVVLPGNITGQYIYNDQVLNLSAGINTISPLKFQDFDRDNVFQIFPNPANDILNVITSYPNEYNIELIDIIGKVSRTIPHTTGNNILNINEAGQISFIRCITKEQNYLLKVIGN